MNKLYQAFWYVWNLAKERLVDEVCICGHHRWHHWFIYKNQSYCIICGVHGCGEWQPLIPKRDQQN